MTTESTSKDDSLTDPLGSAEGRKMLQADWLEMHRENQKMKIERQASLEYSIALQRAIEHHCRGEAIPQAVAAACPHHAKMLEGASRPNARTEARPGDASKT